MQGNVVYFLNPHFTASHAWWWKFTVYNEETLAVAMIQGPSVFGISSMICNMCLVSLKYAHVFCTAGCRKLSIYRPILAVRESIPLTIGLGGGLILSLCIFGMEYRIGVRHDSGVKNFPSFLLSISLLRPRWTICSSIKIPSFYSLFLLLSLPWSTSSLLSGLLLFLVSSVFLGGWFSRPLLKKYLL